MRSDRAATKADHISLRDAAKVARVSLSSVGRARMKALRIVVKDPVENTHPIGRVACAWGAGLLPAACRRRYIEEWCGWLYDAKAEGEPWYQRSAFCLGIVLFTAPRLALLLRLRRKRATE